MQEFNLEWVKANCNKVNEAIENLLVFIYENGLYCYNYCTSYFYKVAVDFVDDVEKGLLIKVYKLDKQLNYYHSNAVKYYNYEKCPMTGNLIKKIQKKLEFNCI
jgi:hypothetical protein